MPRRCASTRATPTSLPPPVGRLGPRVGRLGIVLAVLSVALTGAVLCAAQPTEPTARSAVYPKGRDEVEPLIRENPLAFLQMARDWAHAHVVDYTCHFQKLERIGGELRPLEKMCMKFRDEPFSVYLKWTSEPKKGQEVIFVRGRFKNEAQVHPSGILGLIFRRVGIDPEGKEARKHSRKPMTMAGMQNMIGLITGQCEEAHDRGDLTLTYEGIRHDGGRASYVLKRVLPKGKGYPCESLSIFVDCEYLVCVRTDAYNWDGDLISHYFYTHLTMNPGLTDRDFDPDNPDYGYRLF